MVLFSKQTILILGLVVGISGAYLCGWFNIIISIGQGHGMPDSVSLPASVGSLLLALGPWIMKLSGQFAKGRTS